VFSCTGSGLVKKVLRIRTADGKNVQVVAEVARTEKERDHGFMERRQIPEGTGMVFVFETDQMLRFWMKNTPTPLSIAYIDSSGRIRDILDMKPYSLEDITSTGYVRYALEVPQGWFSRNGVRTGDIVSVVDLQK
jgi:uncharacterized membrane protein (UPF0127 family)